MLLRANLYFFKRLEVIEDNEQKVNLFGRELWENKSFLRLNSNVFA